MKSIRPLVTITILAVVGVFLFRQLNEGPVLEEGPASEWAAAPLAPGLESTAGDDATSAAPTWPSPAPAQSPTAVPGQPAPPSGATSVYASPVSPPQMTDSSGTPYPALEVPPVPDLPQLSPPSPSPQASASVPLPANVPMAQYPDSIPQVAAPTSSAPPAVSGQVPSLGTATPDVATSSPTPGVTASPTTPLAASPQQQSSSPYAVAKPMIQAALAAGQLPRAHLMLSQWYGDETLTLAERQEVEALLSQLAGTVIYSTQHHLEPAYTVREGDTLESIARAYQVPWQLLAKINGIPRADALQLGQQLKVLRGPFMGVVDLSAAELTLLLDGRYAGKFPVGVPNAPAVGEGEWIVENKQITPGSGVTQASTAYAQPAAAVDRTLVLRSTSPTAPLPTLTMGSTSAPAAVTAAGSPVNLKIAARDAEDIYDILSVGSRVVIRR